MKSIIGWILPVIVLVAALGAMRVLLSLRDEPVITPPERVFPLVEVIVAEPSTVDHIVRSQGTVRPLGEIDLVPEVGGRVKSVVPALRAGAFFRAGELLVEIDPEDLERAVVVAGAAVLEAELSVTTETALARVAREEWDSLRAGEPSALARREPQVQLAGARLASAQARLDQARRDLERTQIFAPFDGRVLEEWVEEGQVIARGVSIARLHRTDRAEVVLPVSDDQLELLDLPLFPGEVGSFEGPRVSLSARFAGSVRRWEGRVRRVEAELDPRTRVVRLIAEIEDPFRRAEGASVPLPPGLFVEAEIEGRRSEGVFVLPRTAWHEGSDLLVVDRAGKLSVRVPQIERRDRTSIVVRSGIAAGDRIVISPLDVVIDGMRVEVREEDTP